MPIPFICPHCGTKTEVADQFAGRTGPCGHCGKPITIPGPGAAAGYAPRAKSGVPGWVIALIVVAVSVVVLIPLAGILLGLLLPATQHARDAARRVQCANNLKQINLALLNYESANRSFPPAYVADRNGRPLYSWRVLILPYLDRPDLFQQWHKDEPWDSPHNRKLADQVMHIFQCPSGSATEKPETNYVMIVGPNTVARGATGIRAGEIRDGMSNTILVAEIANSGINWAEPRDLKFDEMQMKINSPGGRSISSGHRGGANAALCDGSVRFLKDSLDPETLRRLILRNDNQPVDWSKLD